MRRDDETNQVLRQIVLVSFQTIQKECWKKNPKDFLSTLNIIEPLITNFIDTYSAIIIEG